MVSGVSYLFLSKLYKYFSGRLWIDVKTENLMCIFFRLCIQLIWFGVFSTTASLELYGLNLNDSGQDMEIAGTIHTESRYAFVLWHFFLWFRPLRHRLMVTVCLSDVDRQFCSFVYLTDKLLAKCLRGLHWATVFI